MQNFCRRIMGIRRVRKCANVPEYTGSGTGHIHSALREPAAIITPATKNERNFTFMKLLYLDCGMGAAGDMLGAALAELLPDDARDAFTSELNAAGIPGVHVSLDPSVKCGITGTHLTVIVNGTEEKEGGHSHSHEHSHHDHQHDHAHDHSHSHDHHHNHSHEHHHDHSHRSLHDIHHIIDDLKLPEAVRTDILAVYRLIAEAESKAHDKPVSEIHFHEVGTMDAIADIASVCLLLHKLAPDQIIASPIHVGSGQVKCAHGILPVPAPATTYILKDIPIYSGSIQGELCTPTGAALLKHFVTRFDQMPLMTPASTGYGMGTKDFPAANCVRAILGKSFAENQPEQPACIPAAPASATAPASTATPAPATTPASTATPAPAAAPASEEAAITETICELSCNVDDMTGEDIAFAIETFLQNGALDAFTVPCTMKKGRPGVLVTVLCKDPDQKQMTRLILQHTTTLGVRSAEKKRWILSRTESETVIPDDVLANVTTPDMPAESKAHELKTTGDDCTIRSKTSTGFGITRNKYEHDDLEKIARTYGLTLAQVRALLAALHQPQ